MTLDFLPLLLPWYNGQFPLFVFRQCESNEPLRIQSGTTVLYTFESGSKSQQDLHSQPYEHASCILVNQYFFYLFFLPAQPSSPSWSSSSSSLRSSCFRIEGRFTTSPPPSRVPPWGLLSGPPCPRENLKKGRSFIVRKMLGGKTWLKKAGKVGFNLNFF